MKTCLVCHAQAARILLDLDEQPVATHFLDDAARIAATARLALAVCEECGIVQQAFPFPHDMLVPPFDWLHFREPEDHLSTPE